jgi:flagellar FliL protein
MSDNVDDQDMNFAEGEAEAARPAKAKGAGPGLARILMFAGIGLGAVIFIVTVVVITLGIVNKQGKKAEAVPVSEAYQQSTPIYQYVGTIGEIRTRTTDKEPSSVVVKLNLGFEAADKESPNDVTQRLPQIRDFLRSYFSQKTAQDPTRRTSSRRSSASASTRYSRSPPSRKCSSRSSTWYSSRIRVGRLVDQEGA